MPSRRTETLRDVSDSAASAQSAGLHYVSDETPGIRRKKAGDGFAYFASNNRKISDKSEIERINALAIPPAYRDVWICVDPRGHIQATGLDARGRKQYRYHAGWNAARGETKFARLAEFARALPKIRERVTRDLSRTGFPREKVLAMVIGLLEKTAIRIGNAEYARQNGSYGLTTLKNEHAEVSGSKVRFHFKGKSGQWHDISLRDRKLAAAIKKMGDLPGQSLFQYRDETGETHRVESADVNAYIHEIAGEQFTAKDFRTWEGTVAAASALAQFEPFANEKEAQHNVVEAVKSVAQRLGNTPAVCRKAYIHPAIIESYLNGTAEQFYRRKSGGRGSEEMESDETEAAVLRLLSAKTAKKKI